MLIGSGAYGMVFMREGMAIKKFTKLSHLIQEYVALYYLQDCKNIVRVLGVDFSNLELMMELYDHSLRKYLEENDHPETMKIIHGILLGLVELHDRELVHGDIKPGNILIKKDPLKIVLGDCGFVSIAKYAKVERTAVVYRDSVIDHDSSHDMFSLGICILEMVGEIKIYRQPTHTELMELIHEKVKSKDFQKIIYNLVREDKKNRPTSRELLFTLFQENPPRWTEPQYQGLVITKKEHTLIRSLMKENSHIRKINRAKKGYAALVTYLNKNEVDSEHYKVYTLITIMILSSVFGNTGFREQEIIKGTSKKYTITFIHKALKDMLSDKDFVNLLFTT